jgi:hypothetical protein
VLESLSISHNHVSFGDARAVENHSAGSHCPRVLARLHYAARGSVANYDGAPRLKDAWSVEEQDFGFGGKRLDLGKGNGYSKMFVEAFLFNGRVAYYELGIESYSNEWPRIRDYIVDAWRKTTNVEPSVTQHRIAYRKTVDSVLASYRTAVLTHLGEMKSVDIPANLRDSYNLLTSFMENSTVSDGGCGLPPGLPRRQGGD